MDVASEGSSFEFVNATGENWQTHLHGNERKIRRHVRKQVIEKWKLDRRQSFEARYQNFAQSVENNKSLEKDGSRSLTKTTKDASQSPQPCRVPPVKPNEPSTDSKDDDPASVESSMLHTPQLKATGYIASCIKYDFDLHWFSQNATNTTQPDPKFTRWFKQHECSFLTLLPAHYCGSSPLLQRMVDSLLAKASYVTRPSNTLQKRTFAAYGLALKELRTALSCPRKKKSTEVLCAIRILQMCDVLDTLGPECCNTSSSSPSSPSSLEAQAGASPGGSNAAKSTRPAQTHRVGSHTQAIRSLVNAKKASGFQSAEMDKTLLRSLLEPLWVQAYVDNSDFVFEHPSWLKLIRSLESFATPIRHPLALELWIILAPFPRLLRQTGDVIVEEDCTNEQLSEVLLALQAVRSRMSKWIQDTEAHMPVYRDVFRDLFSFALSMQAHVNRAIIALDLTCANVLDIEAEAQELARRVLDTHNEQVVSSGIFGSIAVWATADCIAEAIKTAKDETGDTQGRILDVDVWRKWMSICGRRPWVDRAKMAWKKAMDEIVRDYRREEGRFDCMLTYKGVIWYI